MAPIIRPVVVAPSPKTNMVDADQGPVCKRKDKALLVRITTDGGNVATWLKTRLDSVRIVSNVADSS